jgi:modulator of FtsH protease HflC
MNRAFPVIFFALGLGLILIYNTCYVVHQTEYALVTQFGNPVAIEKAPGLKFKIPFLQTVEYFDNRLLDYSMSDETEINAKDKKRIRLGAFVRWRIVDPLAFARATSTAGIGGNRVAAMNDKYLSNWLGAAMRQVIGNAPLNALLSPERDSIMHDIRDQMERQAASVGADSDTAGQTPAPAAPAAPVGTFAIKSGFGIEIVDVRIVKADLPQENSQAIFNRMQTERHREALGYRAQGDQDAQTIKAKADRERTVILANAQKQAEILRGEGDGQAAKIFADAFGRDPEFFEFYRSMQAYNRALNQKDTTVILSPDSPFLKEFSKPDKR